MGIDAIFSRLRKVFSDEAPRKWVNKDPTGNGFYDPKTGDQVPNWRVKSDGKGGYYIDPNAKEPKSVKSQGPGKITAKPSTTQNHGAGANGPSIYGNGYPNRPYGTDGRRNYAPHTEMT